MLNGEQNPVPQVRDCVAEQTYKSATLRQAQGKLPRFAQ